MIVVLVVSHWTHLFYFILFFSFYCVSHYYIPQVLLPFFFFFVFTLLVLLREIYSAPEQLWPAIYGQNSSLPPPEESFRGSEAEKRTTADIQ